MADLLKDGSSEANAIPTQDQRESEARILKLEAERKILLEQLSKGYSLREWLKSGATAVAFLGLLITAWSASLQLGDSRRAHFDERFEQAVKSLASDRLAERLSGVSALNGFLDARSTRQDDALSALVNGLSIENDPVVRASILDVFAQVKIGTVAQSALDPALRSLVNRDRTVGWTFLRSRRGDLPSYVVEVEPEEGKIASLGHAITLLLRAGASDPDLSDVYCIDCDFSGLTLKSTKFDKSRLRGSKFKKSLLDGSSFIEADLFQVDFTSAHLSGAKFSSPDFLGNSLGNFYGMTSFACADLTNANFDHFNLFLFHDKLFVGMGFGSDISFRGAKLSNTSFISSSYLAVVPYTDRRPDPAVPPLPSLQDTFVGEVTALSEDGKLRGLTEGGPSVRRGVIDPSGSGPSDLSRYHDGRSFLEEMFTDSNWQDAKFPSSLRKMLESQPPMRNAKPECEGN